MPHRMLSLGSKPTRTGHPPPFPKTVTLSVLPAVKGRVSTPRYALGVPEHRGLGRVHQVRSVGGPGANTASSAPVLQALHRAHRAGSRTWQWTFSRDVARPGLCWVLAIVESWIAGMSRKSEAP